jgi:hypothetical protein
MSKTTTTAYLLGISEGRQFLRNYGPFNAQEVQRILDNCTTACAAYDPDSDLGQAAMGERDFWQLQVGKVSQCA